MEKFSRKTRNLSLLLLSLRENPKKARQENAARMGSITKA
jgi:hypothetical protein